MLLQVDVNYLLKNRITVDQFLVAQLIYEKNYDILKAYLDLYSSEKLKTLFIELVKAGLIDNYNYDDQYDFNKFIIKPYFVTILAQGDFFDEFVQTFPTYVVRPDGTKDYLRKEGKLCYMKRLPKWLGSEEWKVYEQRLKDESLKSSLNTEELGYGNKLE